MKVVVCEYNSRFVLFFIISIIFLCSTINAKSEKTDLSIIKELDYNVYYIKEKNMIVCSDKNNRISNNSNSTIKQNNLINNHHNSYIMNEYENESENENGYTCLMKLKGEGIYKINIKFFIIKKNNNFTISKFSNIKEIINENKLIKEDNNRIVDILFGDFCIVKRLNLINRQEGIVFKKELLIRFQNNQIYILEKANSNSNLHENIINNIVFNKNLLKLNIIYNKNNNIINYNNEDLNINLIEKSGNNFKFLKVF
jgi:hypothetical protein